MTEEELFARWGPTESEQLDFKTNASDLGPTIAAMSMSAGGVVLIGVRERPAPVAVVGVADPTRTADRAAEAGQKCGVTVSIDVIDVDGMAVVVCSVPQVTGRIVTTPDGRLLRRSGTQNLPLTGDQLGAFVLARRQVSAELDVVRGATTEALDLRLVNKLFTAEGRKRVTRRAMSRALAGDRFLDVQDVQAESVTKVALLLFCPSARRHLPGAAVTFARIPAAAGSRLSNDRVDVEGDVPSVVEEVERLLRGAMRSQPVVTGLLREEIPEYPRPAVREALVNAVAHRDYALEGASVDIRMFDDRLEIQSPGGLPGHVTVENIRHERFRRNPRLMDALRALRLVEDFGEGVDRMFREMEQRLLGPPIIDATPSSVTVTLSNRAAVSLEDLLWLDLLPDAGYLGVAHRRVLVLARSGKRVSNLAVRTLLAVDREDARRILAQLVARGLLRQEGARGGAHYRLTELAIRSAGVGTPRADDLLADRLLPELIRRRRLTNPEARELLSADTPSARRALQRLVERGEAIRGGIGRGTFYELTDP